MLLPSGNPFKCHEEALYFQLLIPPKRFDIFPPDWGMLRRSRCIQIFLYTSVGPSIVHRNRKRFLLSQSTLREEFVKKKYQVFDIIGLLTILVQVDLSSRVERV